jgi:hypothetical protein
LKVLMPLRIALFTFLNVIAGARVLKHAEFNRDAGVIANEASYDRAPNRPMAASEKRSRPIVFSKNIRCPPRRNRSPPTAAAVLHCMAH